MIDLDRQLASAVRKFWQTRRRQRRRQGSVSGKSDQGSRRAVTGGAQMDGFVDLVRRLLVESGLPRASVFVKKRVVLPGFFRPTKEWDLLAVVDDRLLATIEFKSHVGPSFGNNYNNRAEEALGSATDILTAYREGAFAHSSRPWLGYFLLLEDAPGSTRPIKVTEPHFSVFEEFRGASYEKRYQLLCLKLVRERLYDSACLILSDREEGLKGGYREPLPELSFRSFVASLTAQAIAHARFRETQK